MPELDQLTAAAFGLYVPPFRFEHGFIWDSKNDVVADHGEFDQAIARVRGWGRISYLPDAEKLQDRIGEMIAQALTEFWEKDNIKVLPIPANQPQTLFGFPVVVRDTMPTGKVVLGPLPDTVTFRAPLKDVLPLALDCTTCKVKSTVYAVEAAVDLFAMHEGHDCFWSKP